MNCEQVKEWYSRAYVRYLLLERLKNKEVSLEGISGKDGHGFHKKSMACANLRYTEVLLCNCDIVTDLYGSLPNYVHEDMKLKTRGERIDYFNEACPESYDVAFDLDGPTNRLDKTATEAQRLATHLQAQGMNVEVIFSGRKGFHVETDQKCLGKPSLEDKGVGLWRKHCLALAKGFKIDKVIYTARREWRTPYSIHGKSGAVVLPLTKEQLETFIQAPKGALAAMMPDKVLSRVPLYNRPRIFLPKGEVNIHKRGISRKM